MRQVYNAQSPFASNILPEEWTWQLAFNNDVSLKMKDECFLKSNNPSNPLQLRDAQEVSRFFDDYLLDHPVSIFRLGQDYRLRFDVTLNKASRFVIDRVLSVTAEPLDADFSNVVVEQRCRDGAVMAMALLRPSNRCIRRTLSENNTGRRRIVVEDDRDNYFGSDEDVIEVPASHALFFCSAEDRHV